MKKPLRLLIVDDDADDRTLFLDAVREIDNSIVCVELTNGEEALDYLKEIHNTLPDCIFMDLRMPRISGKQCLVEIKENERLRDIPVYIYTTSRDVVESRTLREIGAFHFISKPNDADEIYYLLALALEEQFRQSFSPDQN